MHRLVTKLLTTLRALSITVHAGLVARWQQVHMSPSLLYTNTTYSLGGSTRSTRGREQTQRLTVSNIKTAVYFTRTHSVLISRIQIHELGNHYLLVSYPMYLSCNPCIRQLRNISSENRQIHLLLNTKDIKCACIIS